MWYMHPTLVGEDARILCSTFAFDKHRKKMSEQSAGTFMPIAINIAGKRIVIVGGGRVGLHKASILSRYTSEATVVSPAFAEGFESLSFLLIKKEYEPSDLDGAFMVYICTENHSLNAQVKRDAEERHVLASVCDSPAQCDFTSPAVFREGDMCVAVSSNARDVRRSIRVRDRIAYLAKNDPTLMK